MAYTPELSMEPTRQRLQNEQGCDASSLGDQLGKDYKMRYLPPMRLWEGGKGQDTKDSSGKGC